jgi:hypothetical protein
LAELLAAVAAEPERPLGKPGVERASKFSASMLVHGWDVLGLDNQRRTRKEGTGQLRAAQLLSVWVAAAAKRWCGGVIDAADPKNRNAAESVLGGQPRNCGDDDQF